MKRLNLLPLLLIAVVVAFATVGCMATQGSADENYDMSNARHVGNLVYLDDPYRGTVVLERDPYTGRYYDVTNSYYGGYPGYYSPYGSGTYRNYRNYNYGYPRTYSTQPQQPTQQQPSQQQQRQYSENRNEARERILGRH